MSLRSPEEILADIRNRTLAAQRAAPTPDRLVIAQSPEAMFYDLQQTMWEIALLQAELLCALSREPPQS